MAQLQDGGPVQANTMVGKFESNVLLDRIKALETDNERLKKDISLQTKKMQDLIL